MASASTASPESRPWARMRAIASRSRRSCSRFTFMSSNPANTGSRGNCMFGVTGAAPSAYSVTADTRNVLSAVSASRRFACARSSWPLRMRVSSVRFWRLSSAAAATNRSATAFTTAVMPAASGPPSSSRRKLPSRSRLVLRRLPSARAASYGALTVNSTVRPRLSAAGGGTHAKPSAAPTESPVTPCCSMPALFSSSVNAVPPSFTTSRYVPPRTRSLMPKPASASESRGSWGATYSRCCRTTSSSTTLVCSRSVHPEEMGSWPDQMGPSSRVGRATVWIQVPARPTRDEGPIWSGQLPISSGWTDLLHTNVVLEEVVRQQRLYVAPQEPRDSDALAGFGIKDRVRGGTYRLVVNDGGTAFTLEENKAGMLQHGVTGDSVGAALGFAWVPPPAALSRGRTVEFTVSAPYEAARALGKRLKTSLDLDGNFLRLELGGPDAAGITAVVNAVAERFVAAAAELKRQNLTELTRILSGQLERAQANLRDAETALKTFRVSAVTEYADGAAPVTPNMQFPRDPVFAGLLDMKVNREQLRRDREAIARILAQGRDSGLAVDALAMIGSVEKSTELSQALRDLTGKVAELRALRGRYTDANVAVRRVSDEVAVLEQQTIPALATKLTQEMAVQEAGLAQRVDSAAGGLRRIPPLAVEETQLQRSVTLAEQVVTNLQQRYEEARLAEVSAIPDVRLIDPAIEPQLPAASWAVLLVDHALPATGA